MKTYSGVTTTLFSIDHSSQLTMWGSNLPESWTGSTWHVAALISTVATIIWTSGKHLWLDFLCRYHNNLQTLLRMTSALIRFGLFPLLKGSTNTQTNLNGSLLLIILLLNSTLSSNEPFFPGCQTSNYEKKKHLNCRSSEVPHCERS